MGITLVRGCRYFVKRVPKRFAHADSRQKVIRALWTGFARKARIKATLVEAEYVAYWEPVMIRIAPQLIAAIDNRRREEPDLPTRPEMIRRLLMATLDVDRES